MATYQPPNGIKFTTTTGTLLPAAPAVRQPRLKRIRVEIEQPDGTVHTTVLVPARVTNGTTYCDLGVQDMGEKHLHIILLDEAAAAQWLKRLAKRGIT